MTISRNTFNPLKNTGAVSKVSFVYAKSTKFPENIKRISSRFLTPTDTKSPPFKYNKRLNGRISENDINFYCKILGDMIKYICRMQRCQSGRMCRSRKPIYRKVSGVQIPLSAPRITTYFLRCFFIH